MELNFIQLSYFFGSYSIPTSLMLKTFLFYCCAILNVIAAVLYPFILYTNHSFHFRCFPSVQLSIFVTLSIFVLINISFWPCRNIATYWLWFDLIYIHSLNRKNIKL